MENEKCSLILFFSQNTAGKHINSLIFGLKSPIFLFTFLLSGGFEMQDLKTYLFVTSVVNTIWFETSARSLDRDQSFFSRCIDISFFSF